MPRSSAEERSAAFYRAGKKPALPPRGMTAAGRKIWREIVASKPVDWFDAASLETLQLHCENTASAHRISRDLRRVKPSSVEFRHLSSAMKTLIAILASSGRQLRLTVQRNVDYEGRMATERGVLNDLDDDLIGGHALSNGVN